MFVVSNDCCLDRMDSCRLWNEMERLGRDLGSQISWTLDWPRAGRKVTGDSTFHDETDDKVPFPENRNTEKKKGWMPGA